MVVVGMNAFVFDTTERTCSVKPFLSEVGITKNVHIVDGVIVYDCQYIHQTYIFIICNVLYISTMQHKLIYLHF